MDVDALPNHIKFVCSSWLFLFHLFVYAPQIFQYRLPATSISSIPNPSRDYSSSQDLPVTWFIIHSSLNTNNFPLASAALPFPHHCHGYGGSQSLCYTKKDCKNRGYMLRGTWSDDVWRWRTEEVHICLLVHVKPLPKQSYALFIPLFLQLEKRT